MSNMCSIEKDVSVFVEKTPIAFSESDLKDKISALFSKDNATFVLQENSDSVALFNFVSADSLDLSTVQRVRIFSDKSELITQKEGDTYVICIVSETNNEQSKSAVARSIKYVLREAPHNLCKGKVLQYKEYFVADEDGMLEKYAERLVGVEG